VDKIMKGFKKLLKVKTKVANIPNSAMKRARAKDCSDSLVLSSSPPKTAETFG
jgi:hypothetical protein